MAELRATEIFTAPGLRLIAIESIAIDRHRSGGCCGLCATLAPLVVIAVGEHGIDALDPATGEKIELDRLRRELPGLDEMLGASGDSRRDAVGRAAPRRAAYGFRRNDPRCCHPRVSGDLVTMALS